MHSCSSGTCTGRWPAYPEKLVDLSSCPSVTRWSIIIEVMYVRAVWKEGDREEEGVVPQNWVDEGEKVVRWPSRFSVTKTEKAIRDRVEPEEDWLVFPLLKIKMTSAKRRECAIYNLTSLAEDEEEDDERPAKKRPRKKKNIPDFLENDTSESDEESNRGPTLSSFPEPPAKVSPLRHSIFTEHPERGVSRSRSCSTRGLSRSPNPTPSSSATSHSARRPSSTPSTRRPFRSPNPTPSSSSATSPSARRPSTSQSTRRPSWSPSPRRPSWSPSPRRPSWSPSPRRPSGSPSHRRPSGSPSHRRPSGSPSHRRPSGSPSHRRPSGSPSHRRPSGSPSHRRPSGSPSHRRRSGSPSHRRRSGSPSHRRRSGSPSHRRRSGSSSHRRRSGSSSHRRRSGSSSHRRRSRSPSPRRPSKSGYARYDVKTWTFPLPQEVFQKKVLSLLLQIRDQHSAPTSALVGNIVRMETMEQFEEEEVQLMDPSNFERMVQCLARVGGRDAKECVRKVLDRLFTNALMAQFNMMGKGQKEKRALKGTKLFKAIQEGVMRFDKAATEDLIRQTTADHLKHAPQRRKQ
ncbi:serine/arginine repetitive matrix protein 1-like [Cololabis saira]|uniref:serine/arginine repetitive matrix protein 1-like n=1 Tax=Cololabis saira TaxID=129043 RepID=UPI002AD5A622|nr:serine/arginine repetitive matrix protein 1-like [Cololabis saira]